MLPQSSLAPDRRYMEHHLQLNPYLHQLPPISGARWIWVLCWYCHLHSSLGFMFKVCLSPQRRLSLKAQHSTMPPPIGRICSRYPRVSPAARRIRHVSIATVSGGISSTDLLFSNHSGDCSESSSLLSVLEVCTTRGPLALLPLIRCKRLRSLMIERLGRD